MLADLILSLALLSSVGVADDPNIIRPHAPPPALVGRDLMFVHEATLISTVLARSEPVYSAASGPAKAQAVVAEVYVDVSTGKPIHVEMKESPSEGVSNALREALLKWRFKRNPAETIVMGASVVYYLVADKGGKAKLVPAVAP